MQVIYVTEFVVVTEFDSKFRVTEFCCQVDINIEDIP